MTWRANAGRILKRCVVCGGFHATFCLPGTEPVAGYYCSRCWKERYGHSPAPKTGGGAEPPEDASGSM